MKQQFDRIVRRLTERIWYEHISYTLWHLHQKQKITSPTMHIVARQFDPSRKQDWINNQ